jgi:PIN domain nuclease of toxin-antitoxin system
MRLLLDTHILLWALIEPKRLRKEIVAQIRDPANELLFSAASIAEIAIKVAQGRFDVAPERIVEAATSSGYAELPVASRHAARLASMPMHRDPSTGCSSRRPSRSRRGCSRSTASSHRIRSS